MTRSFAIGLCALLLWLPAMAHLSAASADECDQNCALELRLAGEILPLGELIVMSGVIGMGEVLEANLIFRDNTWLYAFRLLNTAENRVFPVMINARTGAIVATGA